MESKHKIFNIKQLTGHSVNLLTRLIVRSTVKIFGFGLLLLTANFGCKKFVQIPGAPNLITTNQVFADSTDASAALAAMYVSMMGGASGVNAYNSVTVYTGLSSDELITNTGISNEKAIYANVALSTNSLINGLWSTLSYPLIYKANAVIEGVTASKTLSTSVKNQFVGEAKFVRAYCYFHLVNLYGAVPLAISTNFQTNASLPRASIDAVYQQIIADLTSAQNLLPVTYPTPGRVRPNKYTALALRARVYLYNKQWSLAESDATTIINSGLYALSPLNNVFLSTILTPSNTEPIFQLLPVQAGYETVDGQVFVPTSSTALPKYTINSFLLGAFEPGDQRMSNWLKAQTVSGKIYYYPYKYKLVNDGNSSAPKECINVFRLGEIYLIRAEARAQLGESGAASDLNMIRTRAGLGNTTATQSTLLPAIYHERQVELFCELGHRWYDLKRTGQVGSIMGTPGGVCAAKGGTWNSNDYQQLYPISLSDINDDPFLTQNPGYN